MFRIKFRTTDWKLIVWPFHAKQLFHSGLFGIASGQKGTESKILYFIVDLRYEEQLARNSVERSSCSRPCVNPTCVAVQNHIEIFGRPPLLCEQARVQCFSCGTLQCFKCRLPWGSDEHKKLALRRKDEVATETSSRVESG